MPNFLFLLRKRCEERGRSPKPKGPNIEEWSYVGVGVGVGVRKRNH